MNGIRFFIPNALTTGNLAGGLMASVLAWRGQTIPACWLILLCALLDGLDGWAARRLGGESSFGAWFDSCADLVSFGLAPAVLFSRSGAAALAPAIGVAGIYLFCAAGRLIRFQRMAEEERRGDFQGLPTTASGALYAAGRLMFPLHAAPALLHTTGMLALSGLMISGRRFPKIRGCAGASLSTPSRPRPDRSGPAPAGHPA